MPEILKERSELDPQFQWDLTPMFESDAACIEIAKEFVQNYFSK